MAGKALLCIICILALAACGAKAEVPANTDKTEHNSVQTAETLDMQDNAENNETATASTPVSESARTETQSVATAPKTPAKPAATEPKQEQEGYKVTFLEIGAESCIPCKMMQPIMKEIAEEYPGVVEVIFHDLNKNRTIGQQYGIRVMPTQVFLDANGREFFRHEGFYPKVELKAMLDKYLATLE